ncbi:hypothetical protein [Halarcobacter ebronensis]|uniref:Uncharacterized protein n=1 Tax=Halarcobacter ebronensis TaxID=1462615 RepID=A0A4Q1ASZ9_9BACT|nr:hypothetical protein [Halarcobacter ebronensis]QKF82102.1 hypothetical protein AEBR_1619 [Halarcobacter ebronensis]RXK04069.1 hypothetical protein CRV07_11610 [Halarcobacter ebronensis]
MTKEEITQFKKTIANSIIPVVKSMTNAQIKEIITIVEREHKELPEGFGNMLYEQIMMMKHSKN